MHSTSDEDLFTSPSTTHHPRALFYMSQMKLDQPIGVAKENGGENGVNSLYSIKEMNRKNEKKINKVAFTRTGPHYASFFRADWMTSAVS